MYCIDLYSTGSTSFASGIFDSSSSSSDDDLVNSFIQNFADGVPCQWLWIHVSLGSRSFKLRLAPNRCWMMRLEPRSYWTNMVASLREGHTSVEVYLNPWPMLNLEITFLPLGVYDRSVTALASVGKYDRHRSNCSRGLHGFIHRTGRTLRVQIDAVQTPIKISHRRKVGTRPWPVCYLSSWCKVCMEDRKYAGFFLLGGHHVYNDVEKIESMLLNFWNRYLRVDPQEEMPPSPERTIGFYIHGDEGRGQGRRPLLIISFQPIIPWCGENEVNSKKLLAPSIVCLHV